MQWGVQREGGRWDDEGWWQRKEMPQGKISGVIKETSEVTTGPTPQIRS